MIGYVFLTENLKTGKKFIGMNKSVKWDKTYFGQDSNEELCKDFNEMGPLNFSCRMIRACETVKELEWLYEDCLRTLADSSFYNYTEPTPVKKSRKKKVVNE